MNGSGRTPIAAAALLLSLTALAAASPLFFDPPRFDDGYVLPNAFSPEPRRWLFAYDLDAPSADYRPWFDGLTYQRRFLRLASSALLAGEARAFGWRMAPYRIVTVALVVVTLLLIFRRLAERLDDGRAATLALLPIACHPMLREVVGAVNCQAAAVAGLLAAVAAELWIRARLRRSRRLVAAALAVALAAMTAYEAAVLLPLVLVVGDALLLERRSAGDPSPWPERMAALGLLALYLPLAAWIRADLVAPETGPMRPLREILSTVSVDGTAYLAKALLLVSPRDPLAYALPNAIGQWAALALIVLVVVALVRGGRDRRLALLGIVVLVLFLAPPVLVRATVARRNVPAFRQAYLPIALGLPLVLASFAAGAGASRRRALVAAFAIAAMTQSMLIDALASAARPGGIDELVRRALAGRQAPGRTLVVVGGADACGYVASFDWRAGAVVRALPLTRRGHLPEVRIVDERTLEGRAPDGFDVPLVAPEPLGPSRTGTRYGPGGFRMERLPPFDANGIWRAPGLVVRVVERDADRATVLRATLDEPLARSVVLLLDGCRAARTIGDAFTREDDGHVVFVSDSPARP